MDKDSFAFYVLRLRALILFGYLTSWQKIKFYFKIVQNKTLKIIISFLRFWTEDFL